MSERVQSLRLDKDQLRARSRRKWWLVLLLLLIAVSTIAYAYATKFANVLPGASHEVDIVVATPEPVNRVVLDTTGYIVAATTVKISPKVPGTVVELNMEEGQSVKDGEVLAKLDDVQYRADLDQAKAALAAAKAHLARQRNGTRPEEIEEVRAVLTQAEARHDLLLKELERARELQDTIAPAEFDRVQANCLEAEANVTQCRQRLRLLELGPREELIAATAADVEKAKAQVDKAQFFYDSTEIVSPVSGTVLERTVELGETLRFESLIDCMCTIADLDQLQAEIDIQERDLAQVFIGQPCVVTTEAYPDREYQGKLDWLAPIYNRQRGIRRARISIVNPDDKLSPDMNCRVRILEEAPESGQTEWIQVPQQAVVEQDGKTFVFVLEKGLAQQRPVTIGESSAGRVEIREGLRDGELVVVPDEEPLHDGQKVRARAQPQKGSA
jgi:HlyD family secretion protein